MATLIPLNHIPYPARADESTARRKLRAEGADVLASARYEIHDAEGCYSGARPQTRGWVVTEVAARAITDRVVRMPGGTCHRDLAYSTI